MSDREIDYEKLESSIKSLQSDLTRISLPYEDALSFRVFDNARRKMTIFLSILGGITIAGVAFFAFNIYTMAESKVAEYIDDTLLPRLKKQSEEQLKKRIEDISLQVQTESSNQMIAMLGYMDVRANIQLDELLKQIGTKLDDTQFAKLTQKKIDKAVEKKEKLVVEGWSLFGIKNADDTWKTQIFSITADSQEKNSTTIPVSGTSIKAIIDVNLRADLPKYSDQSSWVLAPIKSIIKKDEVINVQQVEYIPTSEGGKYIWVKISRK